MVVKSHRFIQLYLYIYQYYIYIYNWGSTPQVFCNPFYLPTWNCPDPTPGTVGCPQWLRWLRIWCFRPVRISIRSREKLLEPPRSRREARTLAGSWGKHKDYGVKRTWFGNQGLNWVDYVDWILFKYMILIYSVLTRYWLEAGSSGRLWVPDVAAAGFPCVESRVPMQSVGGPMWPKSPWIHIILSSFGLA